MEKTMNFMKDCANRLKELSKLPLADRVISQYERGLITLQEAITSLKDIEVEQIQLQNKIDSGKAVKFIYGMRVRGCSTGAQPDEGFICREGDFKGLTQRDYYDVISYSRRLSEREMTHFSLDYLGYKVA